MECSTAVLCCSPPVGTVSTQKPPVGREVGPSWHLRDGVFFQWLLRRIRTPSYQSTLSWRHRSTSCGLPGGKYTSWRPTQPKCSHRLDLESCIASPDLDTPLLLGVTGDIWCGTGMELVNRNFRRTQSRSGSPRLLCRGPSGTWYGVVKSSIPSRTLGSSGSIFPLIQLVS